MTALADLLAARAQERPEAPVFESARDDRVVTRAQLVDAATAWSHRLDAAGLPAGARVGVRGRDPLLLATAWLGVVASGRCVAPLGPDADADALGRWCTNVRPWVLIDTDNQQLDGSGPAFDSSPGSTGEAGLMLTSSGTTGPAKLVALREDQLLATAANVVAAHELTETDRCLNPLPLWHINAEVVALLGTIRSGGTVVFDERFRKTGFWQVVADKGITWLNIVPAVIAILARDEAPSAHSVRFARSASAPLPPSVQLAFEERTGIGIVQTYGMTEAASQITAERLPHERRPGHAMGSVGRPVGIDLRVLDDEGQPAATGARGRVQIRGAGVITSYASDAGAANITADGWVETGDVGCLSADGELILDGRKDDVINRGGEKFSPLHVEDTLLDIPGVAALAVVGVPDDVLGQVPVAAVVAAEGEPAGLAERVQAEADKRLDKVRRPVRVHLLDSLNDGINGKVSRKKVLQLLRDQGLE